MRMNCIQIEMPATLKVKQGIAFSQLVTCCPLGQKSSHVIKLVDITTKLMRWRSHCKAASKQF